MNDHRTAGMSEALKLTRAGQLTDAFALLQRTLGAAPPVSPAGQSGARESPASHSAARYRAATMSHPRGSTLCRASTGCRQAPGRADLKTGRGPARWTNRPAEQPAHHRPRSRPPRRGRSGRRTRRRNPPPQPPEPAGTQTTISTSPPATPGHRCPWSSCCTVANRTPPTSPPAPG